MSSTQWIKAGAILPGDGERVLVAVLSDSGSRAVTIAWYFADRGWNWGPTRGKVSHPERRITHWQPLPPLPAEEDRD
jgi:hypothetical protein